MSFRFFLGFLLAWLWTPISLAEVPSPSLFSESPEQLRQWAQAAEKDDKESSHILLQDLQMSWDEQGRVSRRNHRIISIRDDRDVQRWSSLSVSWKKAFESRPEIAVRVIRSDNEVRILDPTTIVEAPAGEVETGIYSDAIILKILPPGLAPGSILDFVFVEKESKAPFTSGRYEQAALRSYWPVDKLQVSLSWHPSLQLRSKWPDSLPYKKTESKNAQGWPTLQFRSEAVSAAELTEVLAPWQQAGSDFLEISTARNWTQVAAEYQKIVDEQAVKSKKIPALLKTLKQGRNGTQDIINAVSYYVQKEIRYTSLGFGEASIVPRSPDETLERAYGDCKDKAVLAYALLKEAGISSHLALLHTAPNPPQSDDMPGLDRFNHVILVVPGDKQPTWIDLTAEYFKPGLTPPGVAGQKALVVSPDTRELQTIPVSRSEDNRISLTKTYTVARLGPARLQRTESATGIFDALYRRSLASASVKDILREFETSIDPQIKLESAKSVDFKDYSKPMRMDGTFTQAGAVDVWPAGTQVFAFPHQMFSGLPAALDPLNERDVRGKVATLRKQLERRTQGITLPFLFQREYIFQYILPVHLELSNKPEAKRLDLGPASLTLKTKECGTNCSEFRYSFDTGSHITWSVAEVKAFADALPRVLEDNFYTIAIKPKAFVLSEQGKLREAIQYAQKAVQSKDGQPADRLTQAQLLLRLGLNEEAQQLARSAAASQPQEKRILLHAGELLIRGDDQKDCSKGSLCTEARGLYEQALKLDSSDRYALRTLPLLLVYNNNGLRYGKGADIQKADGAFAKAMKSPLGEDIEFFNSYLQHLTFTGQWIAMDQALKQSPESMPATIVAAWKVIALIGNQHIDEAKQELDLLLAKNEGSASIQGLIKELMQDRRYKEGSLLFKLLKDRLPQISSGASEALAVMEACPEEAQPEAQMAASLRNYICVMLSPDSQLSQGWSFVPSFAQQDKDYKKYFEQVEWARRLEHSKADPSLPPYFLIDSASTAYDIKELKKLPDGTLISLRNTKVFAASPFASSEPDDTIEPRLLAQLEAGAYRFISLDTPSALSILWFRAHDRSQTEAAQEYAKILGELLDRSAMAQDKSQKPGPETLHFRDILKQFRPMLNGSVDEQELAAAVFAPALLNERALDVFERALQKSTLQSEQKRLLNIFSIGRLIAVKKTSEALRRLNAQAQQAPVSFPLVQATLELARSGTVGQDDLKGLIEKLEASEFDEKLSMIAELKSLVGDQKGAEKVYEQWLKSPSPNGLTENNLAWFYFTSGRTDQKALKLAQSASEQAKQSVANLNTLASIQAELGMTDEAVATQNQYRNILGGKSLGAADELVTAINAEKMGLHEAALKRLKKIQTDSDTADLKHLLLDKIQRLENVHRSP